MSEDQMRYVKLTKAQSPSDQEITPGELNQAIPNSQLNVRRCNECGQHLPESYAPPADEPWSTGIFGCTEDAESCRTGLFCPCVLFGRNVENLRDDDTPWTTPCICHAVFVEGGMLLTAATGLIYGIDPKTTCLIWEGLFFTWWMCGIYTGNVRQTLQRNYHLKNSPCDPCLVHCCMHWCALCQEHREMKARLSEDVIDPMTVINPPPTQAMDSGRNDHERAIASSSSPQNKNEKDENGGIHMEMVPL